MAENIYKKVINFIDRYHMIQDGDLIAAGVSGGADSVCMLHILWRLSKDRPIRLLVVHVDHGVRRESAKDAAYVERLCGRLGVPFCLRKADMNGYALEHKLSKEEAGRILRYKAFEEVLGQQGGRCACKIAVAHNANDRAETMLFHLFRGSGIRGAASIRPVRDSVIRPILCLERAEIERYLAGQHLEYCHDSTNEEDEYSRNKIRHHILPYVEEEICRDAVSHMGALADILSETGAYMDKQARRIYAGCVQDGPWPESVCVSCRKLLSEDAVFHKEVLLLCMERLIPHRKDITGQHMADLVKIMQSPGSKTLSLPYGITAYKEYDRLYLSRSAEDSADAAGAEEETADGYEVRPPAQICVPQEGEFLFTLLDGPAFLQENRQNIPENRYTKWFDYDKITTALMLRTRKQGDYLVIDGAMHTKSVKQYMINEKIPRVQRDRMYLLADGSHVLWIPGYRISQGYKVDESTKRILQVQLRGGRYVGTSGSIVE